MEIQEKQLKDNCIGNKSNGSKIEKIKSKSVAENKKAIRAGNAQIYFEDFCSFLQTNRCFSHKRANAQ